MLTAEEIVRMVRIMVKLGINKVRITGGEPLIRMDLEQILSGITAINGISDVPMTTNAIGLSARLNGLCDAGLTRLNISLDSLIPEKYQKITGSDSLPEVLRGIDIAVKKEVSVKINSVLIRGINDDEVDSLIDLGKNQPISIRFIEMMPIGKYAVYHQDRVILNKEILADRPELIPLMDDSGSVAEVYQKPGYQGTVGFISSLSHRFCPSCNRIRLTSDGKLKPCLGRNDEIDILSALRDKNSTDEILKSIIHDAILGKRMDTILITEKAPTGICGRLEADMELTHLDEEGNVRMVDISGKEITVREASARGYVAMKTETLNLIVQGKMPKGDVFAAARIAGIMAAKKTDALIPLCHSIPLEKVSIEIKSSDQDNRVWITSTVRTSYKTGVEMEALTAVSVAALTIYDMCKAVDREMEIGGIVLLRKSGGKTGTFLRKEA